MKKSIKIRLIPTKEQGLLMFKSIGCSRFTYNWALNKCEELYKQGLKYSMANVRKEFTQLKKQEEFEWLNEVSNTTLVESMRNLDGAFKLFFKKKQQYPKFKSKRKSKQSFYVRYDRLYFVNNICNIEKIGKVKFKTNYNIPRECPYSNPYCSFDGKYWYLSFAFEHNENQVELNKDLSNIRNNHIHQTTNKIIKLKPYRVVMEDLNITGMMKNRHLSKSIQEQSFYEFIRQMKYKCEFNCIEFVQVDRFFPSSKKCSCCGEIKKDLKLKDRTYECNYCGLVIDRDRNASFNLAEYKLA